MTARADVAALLAEQARLFRAQADLSERLAEALALRAGGTSEASAEADAVLGLSEAAKLVGEPPSTFRRRQCYRAALVSRPHELRRRYSRKALEKLIAERLSKNTRSAP
jgi:hypothetical protein